MEQLDSLRDLDVLVTGATGFMGSHLCARLVTAGVKLSVLVRPHSRSERMAGRPPRPKDARFLEADITDGDAVGRAVAAASPQVVFHLAALTDVRRDPTLQEPCNAVNLQGTLNLAEGLKAIPVRRVVHLGTCEEYGDGEAPFEEDAATLPVSPYSASKAAATLHMQELGRQGMLPVVVLRPFLTYGPGQDSGRFISQAIRAALENRPFPMTPGQQTREFNHIDDIVGGILRASVTPEIEGEIINLTSGDEWKLLDVAELIFRLAGSKALPDPGALTYREGEAMRFFGKTDKCRRVLGYTPKINLQDGLRDLIAWEQARRRGGAND
jgi:nucleoside-diphosphate-sugar epimerase